MPSPPLFAYLRQPAVNPQERRYASVCQKQFSLLYAITLPNTTSVRRNTAHDAAMLLNRHYAPYLRQRTLFKVAIVVIILHRFS